MRCELAERELSAGLDGQADARTERSVAEHVRECPRCRAFQAKIDRIHELARVQPAVEVPDLVPAIMARVRQQPSPRGAAVITLRRPGRAWGRPAAAFVAGAVAAALLVGGLPLIRPGPPPALASEIPGLVARASRAVLAYRATFRIEERNFHPAVPLRRFTASVAFRAPEQFRADVRDDTRYPSGSWPRNDLVVAMDRDRWLAEGPVTCPREALPACPLEGRERRAVTGREPFDDDTPPPSDVVVPVITLGGSDRVRVVGENEVLGRRVVEVELPYRDATPLFAYLQTAGSWRPFYPTDVVRVALDAETWFPLRYEVWPSAASERRLWSVRNGLPAERPGSVLFRAEAASFAESTPEGWRPRAQATRSSETDQGFRDLPLAGLSDRELVLPADLAGLRPYRAGVFAGHGRPADEILLSYTRGLTWLKLRETRAWAGRRLFGDTGPLAVPVRLSGGAIVYYEPATAQLGRRVSIHAHGWDVYLESNLPREELLRVAASIPVAGTHTPAAWRTRRLTGRVISGQVAITSVEEGAPWLLLPSSLPAGFRPWSAEVARLDDRVTAVTAYFRRPGTELDGVGIRLHQARGTALPPPMDPDVFAVEVRGTIGRYSPLRGELEWVERGVYRSLGGTALDLAGLLGVAGALARPEER